MRIKKRPCHDRVLTPSRNQYGFTLVEVMVSLLIGLVVVLGATQLFMISRQSFEKVNYFGNRQNTLNFSVDVLSRDIRRASFVGLGGKNGGDENRLCIKIEDADAPDEHMEYYLEKTDTGNEKSTDYSLKKKSICDADNSDGEISVLVSGFVEGGLEVKADDSVPGLWELTLRLAPIDADPDPEKITFRVMNRIRALNQENNE